MYLRGPFINYVTLYGVPHSSDINDFSCTYYNSSQSFLCDMRASVFYKWIIYERTLTKKRKYWNYMKHDAFPYFICTKFGNLKNIFQRNKKAPWNFVRISTKTNTVYIRHLRSARPVNHLNFRKIIERTNKALAPINI